MSPVFGKLIHVFELYSPVPSGVHLLHLYGKIPIVVLGTLEGTQDGLKKVHISGTIHRTDLIDHPF